MAKRERKDRTPAASAKKTRRQGKGKEPKAPKEPQQDAPDAEVDAADDAEVTRQTLRRERLQAKQADDKERARQRAKRLEKAALALGKAGDKMALVPLDEGDVQATEQGDDSESGDDESGDDESGDESSSEGEDDGDEEKDSDSGDQVEAKQAEDTPAAPRSSKAHKGKPKRKSVALSSKEGVVYLGHIPHGFFEEQMKGFFSQFGTVVQLVLSRSRKTGRSRGYAFIQFESSEVAKIVQKAMDKYILCDRLLVCDLVAPEKVHERMFANAGRRFRKIDWQRRDAHRQNKPRTSEQLAAMKKARDARHAKQMAKLKAKGIEYELPSFVSAK